MTSERKSTVESILESISEAESSREKERIFFEELLGIIQDEDTVVMLDGMNLYSLVRSMHIMINYDRLRFFFRRNTRLVRMMYYTKIDRKKNEKLAGMLDWMAYNGYDVITRDTSSFDNPVPPDIEMSVDLALLPYTMPSTKNVFIFTGAGQMIKAVEAVKSKGVRVFCVSSKSSDFPASSFLRRTVDEFIDIRQLLDIAEAREDREEVDD